MSFRVGNKIESGNVTVGTTPVLIIPARSMRKSAVVQNLHATNKLYVSGDDTVTTGNTIEVAPGQTASYDDYNGPVWGVANAASTDVRRQEVY